MGVGIVGLESGEEGFSQGAKSIGGSRPVGKIIKMKVVFVGQVNIGTTDGELTVSFRGTTAGAAVIVPEAPVQHATADTPSTTNMLGHPMRKPELRDAVALSMTSQSTSVKAS